MVRRRILGTTLLALLLVRCAALERIAAPSARLVSPHWLQNDPDASARLDHAAWSRFLATYLVPGGDGVNRIAYGRVDAAGRALLDGYIGTLEASAVSRLSRPEQLAYWINLYNAVTTRVVLELPGAQHKGDRRRSLRHRALGQQARDGRARAAQPG